jgi:hypothetical protein
MQRIIIISLLLLLPFFGKAQSVALPQLNLSTSVELDNWVNGTDTFFVVEVSLDAFLAVSDYEFNLTYDPAVISPVMSGWDVINSDAFVSTQNITGTIDLSMSNGGTFTLSDYVVNGSQHMLTVSCNNLQFTQSIYNDCNGNLLYLAFEKVNACYDAPTFISFWNGDNGSYINPQQTHAFVMSDTSTVYSTEQSTLLAIDGQIMMNLVSGSMQQNGVSLEASAQGGTAPYSYEWLDVNWTTLSTDQIFTPDSAAEYILMVYDANGCYAMMSQYFTPPSSTQEVLKEATIYPNPATDIVNIAQEGAFHYVLSDLSGRVLEQGTAIGQTQIRKAKQVAGLYFLHITTTTNQQTHKIIFE